MAISVDGGPVVAHAQAFADEINRRWGFTHIMTYPGHEPDQQHALDNFQTRDVMLQLADWCTHDDVIDQYGIDYVIFNVDESTVGGEIYNREIARYWRHMPDRGSPTQNHHDHVHVSFNPTAQGPFGPSPTSEEDDLYAFVGASPVGSRTILLPPSPTKPVNLALGHDPGAGGPTVAKIAAAAVKPNDGSQTGWSYQDDAVHIGGPSAAVITLAPSPNPYEVSVTPDHEVGWAAWVA